MTALWSNKGSHHVRAHGLRPRWQCPYAGDRGTMGRDERDGPREIMDNALAEMAGEAGGTLGPPRANLAAFRGKTGPARPEARTPEKKGPGATPHGRCGTRAGAAVPAGLADTTGGPLRGGAASPSACPGRIREGATGAARPPSGTTSPATGTSCRPGAGPQPCRRAAAVAGLVPGPARPIGRAGGLPTPGAGWAEPAASRALRRHAATAARRTSASSRTRAGRARPSAWRAPSCRWACRNGCRPTTRGPSRPAATRTAGRSGRRTTRRPWLAWASRPDYAGRGIPSREAGPGGPSVS